jgi:hypothetical protein
LHHAPARDLAHERFIEEAKKKVKQREEMFSTFGAKRERPREVMEKIARRPEARRGAPIQRAASGKAAIPADDYVSRLSSVIGEDYFDKLGSMSKKDADYLGKLANIAKKKEITLENDQVSKLASITKKVSADTEKKKEVAAAFKKSDFDKLDDFLSSGEKLDTFLKDKKPEDKLKSSSDYMDRLSDLTGKKDGVEALSSLSQGKREDVLDALESLSGKKAEKAAAKMDKFASIESKDELFKAFRKMSKEEHIDKNVFSVLLSYLLKSGKINKRDVYDLVLDLEKQGVLDKTDVTSVFFDLGVKE